jgi:hypothetical protein
MPAMFPPAEQVPTEVLDAVIRVCERFESAWREAPGTRIEPFVEDWPADRRAVLVQELAAVEYELRLSAGDSPTFAEYAARFPELVPSTAFHRPTDGVTVETPLPLAVGQAVGRYTLLRPLGQGGMGVVFEAVRGDTGGRVAVKFIRPDVFATPQVRAEAVARFGEEVRAQAAVRHPNVLPVYDCGEHSGGPYYVMPLVSGRTLADRLSDRALAPAEAAGLMAAVADALAATHACDILHRDVNPRNVLLDDTGRPLLADFGLAKWLPAAVRFTEPVQVLGTLAYTAPEQVNTPHALDERADVYSLGATLYECLTGRPPFKAATPAELLHQVVATDPVSPRALNPSVPRDLEMVCLMCLRKERHRRYPSAAAVRDDLRRVLAGEPVVARPLPWAVRAARVVRRHPALAVAVALAVVFGLAIWAAAVWNETHTRHATTDVVVQSLPTADPPAALDAIQRLKGDRAYAGERLRAVWADDARPLSERVRAAGGVLALTGDGDAREFLVDSIPRSGADELFVVRAVLRPHRQHLIARQEAVLRDERAADGDRLRAAALLADWQADADWWPGVAPAVVRQLLSESPVALGRWVTLLRPVGAPLQPELTALYVSDEPSDRSRLAGSVLAALLTSPDDTPRLLDLIERSPLHASREVFDRACQQPDVAAAVRERLKAADSDPKFANLTAVMLRLDPAGGWWKHLDPATRTPTAAAWLTARLAPSGVPVQSVTAELTATRSTPVRRALVLALADYPIRSFDAATRGGIEQALENLHATDPDPGVHSAAEFTLATRWGSVPKPAVGPLGLPVVPAARWRNDPLIGPCAVFPEETAVTVRVGKGTEPPTDPRTVRPFLIATRETTFGELRRWEPKFPVRYNPWHHADPTPVVAFGVRFNEAAGYCNWLTDKAGMGEADMCYSFGPDGAKLRPDWQARAGYRLPSEDEWELACRGPDPCDRDFGAEELMGRYVWHNQNANFVAKPPGLLRPNRYGLFDPLGNAAEWCNIRLPTGFGEQVVRGGSVYMHPMNLTAATRVRCSPDSTAVMNGVRVARSLP